MHRQLLHLSEFSFIFLQRETHLLETLRSNRELNLKTLTQSKLSVGDIIGEECEEAIAIQWKDHRNVLILSTKYANKTVTVRRWYKDVKKPKKSIISMSWTSIFPIRWSLITVVSVRI